MENTLWLLAVGVGPFLLLGVIAYAVIRQRRLTPVEKDRQEHRIQKHYEKPSA